MEKKHAAVSKKLQVVNQEPVFHITLTNPLNCDAQGSIGDRSCGRRHRSSGTSRPADAGRGNAQPENPDPGGSGLGLPASIADFPWSTRIREYAGSYLNFSLSSRAKEPNHGTPAASACNIVAEETPPLSVPKANEDTPCLHSSGSLRKTQNRPAQFLNMVEHATTGSWEPDRL